MKLLLLATGPDDQDLHLQLEIKDSTGNSVYITSFISSFKCSNCQSDGVTSDDTRFAPSAGPMGCPYASGVAESCQPSWHACFPPLLCGHLVVTASFFSTNLSKTDCMTATAPPQHDVFAPPSCTLPASIALHPSLRHLLLEVLHLLSVSTTCGAWRCNCA